jgi:hypothetical protein
MGLPPAKKNGFDGLEHRTNRINETVGAIFDAVFIEK